MATHSVTLVTLGRPGARGTFAPARSFRRRRVTKRSHGSPKRSALRLRNAARCRWKVS